MQKQVVEFSVGVFFLLAIGALIVLALEVSGLSDIYQRKDGYMLTADFENVGGLKPKARVAMAGVSVGRVVAIDFDRTDYMARVTMRIDKNVNNLPEDTKASILTAGLLGDNYIGLTPGFSDQYFKAGSHIPLENTNRALVLEDLVSKFLAQKASD